MFLSYQTHEKIAADVYLGRVYVLEKDGIIVGTGTIKENRICRFVVRESEQRKGYGTVLMNYMEKKIQCACSKICLDSSLPACELYRKRGYVATQYQQIKAENGDIICYPVMEKEC